MKTNYINHILEGLSIPCVAFPSIDGVGISTVYMSRVQQVLSEQPEKQFKARKGVGNIHVSLDENVTNVCQECGSPQFWAKVTELYTAYIDTKPNKAKTTYMAERITVVHCQFCGTKKDVKVHRYPEAKICS